MDLQDQFVNHASKFGENVKVEIVKEVDMSSPDSFANDEVYERHITAFSLRSLLSSELATEAFYFVSMKNKHTEDEHLRNGDALFTRETIDLDSTCSTDRSCSSDSNDISTFGSPLKLQTFANLSANRTSSRTLRNLKNTQKKSVLPVPLCDARKILRKFFQLNINELSVNMMVIFCDGSDHNRTVLLGGLMKHVSDRKILTTIRVTASKVKLSDLEQLSDKTDRQYHLTHQYRIMDKRDGLGSLLLEAKWSDPLGRVKLMKLQSAEFFLHIDVVPGCDQSPVFNYHNQLQNTQVLLEGLKTGEIPEVLSLKTENSLMQLQDFFAKLKVGELTVQNFLPDEDGKSTSIMGMLSGTGKLLKLEPSVEADFTDMLWQIIRNCADFNSLVQCLNATFAALRKGDLKVFVQKSNHTTIAKLVRQSYCGMASFPSLNSRIPLRLAAEIGLEKLRKDYYAIFVNKLCTAWQWDSFFQSLTPDQEEIMDMEELNIRSLEIQFNILSKLHYCLEVVSVVDSFTENQDLQKIAKHVMNHYKSAELAESKPYRFTIPITALQAAPEIKKHPVHFVKRENTGAGDCNVRSLLSELPSELSLPYLSSLLESNDVSSVGDAREFYLFTGQERTLSV